MCDEFDEKEKEYAQLKEYLTEQHSKLQLAEAVVQHHIEENRLGEECIHQLRGESQASNSQLNEQSKRVNLEAEMLKMRMNTLRDESQAEINEYKAKVNTLEVQIYRLK
jgi:hypothetical protein